MEGGNKNGGMEEDVKWKKRSEDKLEEEDEMVAKKHDEETKQ